MKVHSKGLIGEDCHFVYVNTNGDLLTAGFCGTIAAENGFGVVPMFIVYFSAHEVRFTTDDPDTNYECLGEI